MNSLTLRQRLIAIAERDAGQMETSRNRGPAIEKFWAATTYGREGYVNREPYCAAAVAWWVREWLRDPAVLGALDMTGQAAEKWRCKSARAFDWIDWAKSRGVRVLSDAPSHTLHTGDIVVFDFSHIGIVRGDQDDRIFTIEANTGNTSGNDGDGIFRKNRPREVARCFIRLLE